MQRPTGVVLIAVIYFLAACFLVLIGVGLIVGTSLIGALSPEPRVAAVLAGVGAFGGVFLLCLAALMGLMGWALLALKEWARIVTIVLSVLGVIGSVSGLAFLGVHSTGLTVAALIRVIINGLIIWYLLQPQVKRAFALH